MYVLALRGRDPSYIPKVPRFLFCTVSSRDMAMFFSGGLGRIYNHYAQKVDRSRGGEQCPENQEVAVHLACLQLLGRKKLHSGLVAHASSAQIRER